MINKSLVDKLMNSNRIRNLGLKEGTVIEILESYDSIILDTLLENGVVNLGNGITIDVVHLLDRVHTLRGIPYPNTRKFKLKVTLDDNLYNRIADYYNKLKEDIL